MEPPTNACWKRRAALKGTLGISARSSVHHDSLSVRPRQPEVSVFPRDATLRFIALAAVFRRGEPRTGVWIRQGALVVNHRRGRQKSRRVGFFAITLCGSAFPRRSKNPNAPGASAGVARPGASLGGGASAVMVGRVRGMHTVSPGFRPGLLDSRSAPSVRGCPCPESRRCSGTDPSQRIGRRRQDAGAKSASSERRPWMAVANVRRRGMGSPEPLPDCSGEFRRSSQDPACGLKPTSGRWRFRCDARSCRAGRR